MKPQMILIIVAVIIVATMLYCSSNNKKSKESKEVKHKGGDLTLMFYNVENLFDTVDAPDKIDEEFLPNSEKRWNTKRYNKKLNDLAKVISSIKENSLPDIIGLAEVENRQVLEDLAAANSLKSAKYAIVQEESPDVRGIDVALLYKKSSFKYLKHEIIRIKFDFSPKTKTRDILYVKGKLNNGELLHVFVNHWSSRREGQKKTEIKRKHAAKLLKNEVDKILDNDKNAKIIIVGDFNDEPQNKSLKDVLSAANSKENVDSKLYNLLYAKDLQNKGTYNYKGDWQMLDNVIVSRALLNSDKGYTVPEKEAKIFAKKWMLFYNKKYKSHTPSRTYGGANYYGGFSDHLPVFVELKNN